MSSETKTTPAAPTEEQIAIMLAHLPERAGHFPGDTATYFRELPRLLAEKQEGRCALIAGGEILGIWDSPDDALRVGYERFGIDGVFSTPQIRARDMERLVQFARQETQRAAKTMSAVNPCPN